MNKKYKRKQKRKSAYLEPAVTMIYNPLAYQQDNDEQPDTELLPFSLPLKITTNKKFIRTLNKIQSKFIALYYPDDFYLHIPRVAIEQKSKKQATSIENISEIVKQKDIQLLAWCWYYSIQWAMLTDTLYHELGSDFDEQTGISIEWTNDKRIPVNLGMTFDDNIEGVHVHTGSSIELLFNPTTFDSDWDIMDVIDLAIHECTHFIALNHDEDFIYAEAQLRKEFRQVVLDTDEIIYDAKDILSACYS